MAYRDSVRMTQEDREYIPVWLYRLSMPAGVHILAQNSACTVSSRARPAVLT